MEHYHRKVGHGALSHTFCAVKERFWLLRGNSRIRKVLWHCVVCRRVGTSPSVQQIANLPDALLQAPQSVFFQTGCDCFDPLLVKQDRSLIKGWGCIFPCLTVRDVHLEVLYPWIHLFLLFADLFISRRGLIGHLHSDNVLNFVGANKVLREALKEWNKGRISIFLLQNEIECSNNTLLVSHLGSCWERVIRSVRRTMASSYMTRSTFTEEGLVTLFAEVKAIISFYPLTPELFVDEIERPLSPYDLLVLVLDVGLPPARTTASDLIASKSWRQVQAHADLFWKRWFREYLPTLRIRSK